MRLIRTLKQSPFVVCVSLLFTQLGYSQVCSNPAGVIYGMDNNGGIFPVTVATAVVGARINPAYPGNAASASNAIGYNPSNGRFYYFKRNADNAPQEFVSFNPSTNTYTILTDCPTTNNIRTGCVNVNGTGYYCLDAAANLYFYRISSNTWKVITNKFFDQFGTNVSATLAALSSGDMACDGWGNLWLLCSSTTNYGLYLLSAPLPVAAVASLTIKQKIAPTTLTPLGANFAGIGFSPTGEIYVSQSGDKLYRLNTDHSLTLLGTFTTAGVGGDLTSCNFPMAALAANNQQLTVASIGADQVLITWSSENQSAKGFFVEYSKDAENWTTLGFIESNNTQLTSTKYSYTYSASTSGRYYYRIKQVGQDGQMVYSQVKFIDLQSNTPVSIGPNPTRGTIKVNNNMNAFTSISIMDVSGKVLRELQLGKGLNSVALTGYPSGTYIIRMQAENGLSHYEKIIKE